MLATTYSLFVVGVTSFVGAATYFSKQLVNLRTGLFFGIPSVATVLLTRRLLIPAIPQQILTYGRFTLTKSMLMMLLFAVLMVLASWTMIKKRSTGNVHPEKNRPVVLVLLQGIVVGIVTGFIGAGGGFLIIPVLVNMLKLSMKAAVGTSLFIIAVNSLSGFFLSPGDRQIQWGFLLTITAIAIIGTLAGSYLSTKIDGKKLKPAFGWFVLVMGIYILVKESILK